MTLLLDIPEARSSPLHRLDPRWKLAALLPAACAVTLLQTPLPALTAVVAALALVLLARLPWRWYGLRLAGGAVVAGVLCALAAADPAAG